MKRVLYFTILFLAATSTGVVAQETIFPKGEIATTKTHTGTVWLNLLNKPDSLIDVAIATATFAPGARLNWHTHPAGQILLITEGIGYYQEKGKPVQIVHKGDIIKCSPGLPHWHGAAPESSFTYLAASTNSAKNHTVWLQPVTDEEYNSAKK
ncbi:cupin domain-containing protein [Flavihumibacter sp. R14]|nr:cupin domain-containing protein [Flavihumibacter soli]